MANQHKGEAEFVAASGATYRLLMDHNALAEAEDILGLNPEEMLRQMHETKQTKFFRALLYGALKEHHPTITLRDAGKLLGEGEVVGEAIGKAMMGAFGPPVESAEGKVKARPGRGTISKKRGQRSPA
jgi:hypothetical protein